MKLYHFNPNGYGSEYYVMSEDRSLAEYNLLQHLLKKSKDEGHYQSHYNDEYNFFENWLINKVGGRGYTIDEYDKGQVIESEIA